MQESEHCFSSASSTYDTAADGLRRVSRCAMKG